MKQSDFKKHLSSRKTLAFIQTNGDFIPAHFHITEIGLITKQFIDCGGEIHIEKLISMQIWVAQDFDHRLNPIQLLNIIDSSKKITNDEDLEIEVEYQTETIGKYALEFKNDAFILVAKNTNCLAKLNCGIPQPKQKLALSEIGSVVVDASSCAPQSGCC